MLTVINLAVPWLLVAVLSAVMLTSSRPRLWRRIRRLRAEVRHQADLARRAQRDRDAALAALERIADGCPVPQAIAVVALERGEDASCGAN
ncbi:hypothetical protein [Sorangium sp. So ce233]|uniref:hypothetical protein n=1 Tax=Sorangium sp. So ce233 TaxID=3133290 RepID=UPI003F5FED0E